MPDIDTDKIKATFNKLTVALKELPKKDLPTSPEKTMELFRKIMTEEDMDFLDKVHGSLTLTQRNTFVKEAFAASRRYIIKDTNTPDGKSFDLFVAESV